MDRLKLRVDGAWVPGSGLSAADLDRLAPLLEAARRDVLEAARRWEQGQAPAAHQQPLDAGFLGLPDRLLDEHRQKPDGSEVARIRAAADRLADTADCVVLLGIGGSYMGARALMEALAHPYHNHLPRRQRGGRPRLYFEGDNLDNDAIRGLLDLLAQADGTDDVAGRWAIVVISKSGGTLETAVALRIFLAALREAHADDRQRYAPLVVPVTGESGKLRELSKALGCPDVFDVPEGVGGRFSIFSAVGLLPAAVLGLDIEPLLRGAADLNEHFRTAPVEDNLVLQYAGLVHLAETTGRNIRVLSTWGKRLEAVGLWHDQLVAESLGKGLRGVTPLVAVNTRDLHSRGQQHQEGRLDKFIVNCRIDRPQRDAVAVPGSPYNQDQLQGLADRPVSELLAAATAGTNQAYAEAGRPTIDLHLPALTEQALGQLLQFFMLATVVEGVLLGVNPYGQPGVEAYKRHMKAFLEGKPA